MTTVSSKSNLAEILSILEQNPLVIQSENGILIGSRAACWYLPHFREKSKLDGADWDVIISSNILLKWLHSQEENILSIEMLIPTIDDLDLYVNCVLVSGQKYDFSIPRSSTSYTTYILAKENESFHYREIFFFWRETENYFHTAAAKILLILKKYMLYYSHQWEKTARDYWQLLGVTDPLDDDDFKLRDLFIIYNEKFYGKRPENRDEFVSIGSVDKRKTVITKTQFFQLEKAEQVSLTYKAAMSISDDILVGLEQICTQGPLWLSDYVIDNWIDIQNEKFKKIFRLPDPCFQFEIENHRLFPTIPEIPSTKILRYLTNVTDFHSMQFVCKRWYTIMRQDTFWRDLYLSRYRKPPTNVDDIISWKMLYLIRLEGDMIDKSNFKQLVNSTIQLRQLTVNNVVQLWEDLTHREQTVESNILSKIDYILCNSFYYHMEQTSDHFSVKLNITGLEDTYSRSKIDLKLRFGEYGNSSRFSDHMEHLTIGYSPKSGVKNSIEFFGPQLVGYAMANRGYVRVRCTLLDKSPSSICPQFPSGLLICLFIMMVHSDHRAQFIKYLKHLVRNCIRKRTYWY